MAGYSVARPGNSILNYANDAAYDEECADEPNDAKARDRYEANVQKGVNAMQFLDVARRGDDQTQFTIVGVAAHCSRELQPYTEVTVTYEWDFWQRHREQRHAKGSSGCSVLSPTHKHAVPLSAVQAPAPATVDDVASLAQRLADALRASDADSDTVDKTMAPIDVLRTQQKIDTFAARVDEAAAEFASPAPPGKDMLAYGAELHTKDGKELNATIEGSPPAVSRESSSVGSVSGTSSRSTVVATTKRRAVFQGAAVVPRDVTAELENEQLKVSLMALETSTVLNENRQVTFDNKARIKEQAMRHLLRLTRTLLATLDRRSTLSLKSSLPPQRW